MITFKKSTSIAGKFKGIATDGHDFFDFETGEHLDLAKIFYDQYMNTPFDLSSTVKQDEELDVDTGEE